MTGIKSGHRDGVAEVYNTLHCDIITAAAGVVQLSTETFQVFGVIIQNRAAQTSVYIGNYAKQHFELVGGASVTIPVDQLAKIYISFADGEATVAYLAMG